MKLLSYPHESLSTKCTTVESFDTELAELLQSMKSIMTEKGGCGLSANQVGITKRVFVMESVAGKHYEIINPEIIGHGEVKQNLFKEGCLSSPDVYEFVPRYDYILLRYQDRNGTILTVYATEPRDVVCIQHEIDHLDGIFWFDRLPRNQKRAIIRKWRKKHEI